MAKYRSLQNKRRHKGQKKIAHTQTYLDKFYNKDQEKTLLEKHRMVS